MALRLDVALPAAVTFFVGVATGLVVAHVSGLAGVRVASHGEGAARAPADPQTSAAGEDARLREMLVVHERLLTDRPDDPTLLRTVGNYHAALGQSAEALAHYERAAEQARRQDMGDAEVAAILVDEGIVRAEQGDVPAALERLEEAARLDPASAQARVVQAYVYLTRVMPDPPPGFDRRTAVTRAEALIDEALRLDPGNADALQFRALMESVRRGRTSAGSASTPP